MAFIAELRRRNVVKVCVLYTVAAWLTLQVADLLFDALDLPNTWLRLVIALLVLGFPIALVFAWVFEVTPQGIKRESAIDRNQSITAETGRKINVVIAVLLILAIAAVIADRLLPEARQTDAGELSIAVLPFVDMSAGSDQEYLADGISEELLNLLAKVPRFRVAGRTSSFAFKGQNEDLRDIGEKLNVGVILEGSVRSDGDDIRVTAQLVKADDGYHLWSETYDRKLESIFALQDDIANKVVAELKGTLLGDDDNATMPAVERGQPTENREAYASYLRGTHLLRKRGYDDLFRAVEEFQKAVTLDPEFAEAHAGLALTYMEIIGYGYRSVDELGPNAAAASDAALALDPEMSDAWVAKGLLLVEAGSYDEAHIPLERAVDLNPNNSTALVLLSERYFFMGQSEDSNRLMDRAYDVDPLSPVVLGSLALQYKQRGDNTSSAKYLDELSALDEDSGYLNRIRARLSTLDGDYINSVKWLHRAVVKNQRDVYSRLDLASELISIGAVEAAERYAREALQLAPDSPRAVVRHADAIQYQGRYDEALAMVDAEMKKYPNDALLRSYRITVLHHAERFAEAQSEIVELAPSLAEDPPRLVGPYAFFWAPRFAWMQDRVEATPTADTLHSVFLNSFPFPDIASRHELLARWAAATGDGQTLVAELAAHAETMPEGAWDLFRDPMIGSYSNEPGFSAIAQRFEDMSEAIRSALADEGVL